MSLHLFNNMTEKDKSKAVQKLIVDSTPRPEFFLLVALSILMATFGLLAGSESVIIGSMLVAPILFPIMSLGLGVTLSDPKLITRSFVTLLKAVGLAVGMAAIVSLFFSSHQGYPLTNQIMERTNPSILYSAVAIVAGLAASFALVKPTLSETLPGIAISTALIPPLATVGIGISRGDWFVISNAFLVFIINAVGIVFASITIFSMMNLYLKRKVATAAIIKEEKALKSAVE